MSESYYCDCGKLLIFVVRAGEVSSTLGDWRICPRCDGPAADTALMPAHRRAPERGWRPDGT